MLKIKKINLSGFRGILNPQPLDLMVKGSKEPRSLVLFGLNSSGKTSFVDGLEWFLSEENKIEWLRRDEAEEKAYPHQAAKDKRIGSFVEVEFSDTENKIGKLTKTYDHSKITKPILSEEDGFTDIYSAFVIRPYFRYLEVVDFVCSKAKEKYKRLAQWMGFETEFEFQEQIARVVHQKLKNYEDDLAGRVVIFEKQLKQLTNDLTINDAEVLSYCNAILKQHEIDVCKTVNEVWRKIPEISKKKTASSVGVVIDKLTRAQTAITASVLKTELPDEMEKLRKKIEYFRKDKTLIQQIDIIGLHTQALEILTKQTEASTICPVCGKEWKRGKLMEHIKSEIELLKKTKEEKEAIEHAASSLKAVVSREANLVNDLIGRYGEAQEVMRKISIDNAKSYLGALTSVATALTRVPVDSMAQITLHKESLEKVATEKNTIIGQIKAYKTKIQPSAEDTKLSEDIEKLTQIKTIWQSWADAVAEQKFTSKEINKFYALKDAVVQVIQGNVKARFDEISNRIGEYFRILRNDKDIRDIKIVLNEERGRAAGRSAEIELNYYDISVRPAYKVLSESLLNSLGLAVYFTCVKQFNDKCRFIVLDDIMNSLDIDKRDTLLDLINQEFSDYQIIIFTHDHFWFQKILQRFPTWINKKIQGWDYLGGAKIGFAGTTKEEINACLADSTKIEDAGWKLGRYVEDNLNELCEKLWAEVRYRYSKNDPPSMDELFNALYKRLKEKAGSHPAVAKVLEAKKYEPVLRNFVVHARSNRPSVSPQEIRRAAAEWFALETEFWCEKCRRYVEYHRTKDSIECRCGNMKIQKVREKTL